MLGPFFNQNPHQHPSVSSHHLRSSLESDFKNNQCDVFVLNQEEFLTLWVASQQAGGKPQTEIEKYFSEITGLSIAQGALAAGAAYGSAVKDTPSFIALANDFKRSGNILGRYELSIRNGKQYISFKGNHKVRTILKGTRYLAANTQVVNVGVGKEALKQGAKGGFFISVFFSITLNSINWIFEADYRWTNWLATTSTDIVKAVIGAIAGVLFGLALVTFGSVAVVAIGGGILVGVIVGIVLKEIDEKLKITDSLVKYLEAQEKAVSNAFTNELHRIYIVTTEKIVRSIKIKIRKELSEILNKGFG